ncbi:hypothetical protein PSTG_09453 [Puccinia striiformis f. sp. tritici PST-78]|uniref:Uncharacterized protein n=1 Tax=Puccinia striiformis f. sp. tritici PST-78 TaxID=1165861 RepID=A0A0L0VDC3_9BASI|nr:hypothetical protein PSTG_09453 [Puccinia striiformis f. sp. tritici PST-78]
MSSPPHTGNTSTNRPSSPVDYTLSDITGIGFIDRRSGAERVAAIFNEHLGEGWEGRLGVHRSPRQRAYSETDTTVTSFRIPGSFIPPRPSTPLPHRLPIPVFTPPTQSTSRLPNHSTPFRFHSPPRPNPSFPHNRQTLPTDVSFILSPSFSFRPPHVQSPPPPPPPPPGY